MLHHISFKYRHFDEQINRKIFVQLLNVSNQTERPRIPAAAVFA